MDYKLNETSIKKTNPNLLIISGVHLAIAIISIVILFQSLTHQELDTYSAVQVFFTVIKALLIILNIIACFYILKRKAIGWWSNNIYFGVTFLMKLDSTFNSLKVVIGEIKYLDGNSISSLLFSVKTDKLKLSMYEAVISLIIIVFLFQSNNIIRFNLIKQKKHLLILLTVISVSIMVVIYLTAYINGVTIRW